VKHDGHLGRLISPSAAVTPVSTRSVVSVSGSVASALNDHAPLDAQGAGTRAPEPSPFSGLLPKPYVLFEPNPDAKCGRGRSPRRSSSTGTRNITDRVYQPTFSSSSRSSSSPVRSSSRGRGRLSMKENEPAATPVNRRLGEPTNQNDRTSPARRRASTPAHRQSLAKNPQQTQEIKSSRSRSLSTVSSSQSASCSSSAHESRPAQPMRVRRQTDGHPQRYVDREYARGRLESGGERPVRGRSRVPPEARVLAVQGDERRGRSLMR
jgi:hypothetical protein